MGEIPALWLEKQCLKKSLQRSPTHVGFSEYKNPHTCAWGSKTGWNFLTPRALGKLGFWHVSCLCYRLPPCNWYFADPPPPLDDVTFGKWLFEKMSGELRKYSSLSLGPRYPSLPRWSGTTSHIFFIISSYFFIFPPYFFIFLSYSSYILHNSFIFLHICSFLSPRVHIWESSSFIFLHIFS